MVAAAEQRMEGERVWVTVGLFLGMVSVGRERVYEPALLAQDWCITQNIVAAAEFPPLAFLEPGIRRGNMSCLAHRLANA